MQKAIKEIVDKNFLNKLYEIESKIMEGSISERLASNK